MDNLDISHQRQNSFNAIRLFAALCVFVSHQFSFLGRNEPALGPLGISLASTGLYIFFALSGYLIAQSLFRNSDVLRFTSARFLRIYPAAVANTLFCVGLGAVITVQPASVYWRSKEVWQYLIHNGSIVLPPTQFSLPGVLETATWPVVNGSIWTLKYELVCYTVLLLLFLACRFRREILRPLIAVCLGVAVVCYIARITYYPNPTGLSFFADYNWFNFIRFIMTFFAGAFLALATKSESRTRYAYALFLLSACLIVFGPTPEFARGGVILLLVLLVVEVGKRSVFYSSFYQERVGDLSYGTFLYAYPIQNVLVTRYYNGSNALLISAVCLALTLICAFVSWRLIERPTLSLKDRSARNPRTVSVG